MKGLKKRLKKVIVTALIAGLTVNGVPVTAYGARVVSEPGPSCGVQVTPGTVSADDMAFEGVSDNASEAESNESVSDGAAAGEEAGGTVSEDGAAAGEEAGGTVSEDAAAKADEEASAGSTEEIREISDNTLPTGSGSYKLTKDVTISETWVVSANITLDLAGHTITMSGNEDVIKVAGDYKLTISDSNGAGGITHGESYTGRGVYVDEGGSFIMNGGSIYGNSVSGNQASGGGVFVGNGGRFTMTDGSISGNTADVYEERSNSKGGGVFVDEGGSFTMTGGSIYKNRVNGNGEDDGADGAGVYINGDEDTEYRGGSFIMNGGSIFENEAYGFVSGAGVFVGNGCSFRMTGGSIYENRIQSRDFKMGDGGGVYVGNGGSFEMTGGSISGNEAAQFHDKGGDGGGVFVGDGGSFRMTGGSIYENKTGDGGGNGGGVCVNGKSNFTMSGNAVIRNNYANKGNGGGVYVDGDSFRMTGGSIYENKTGDGGGNGGGVYVKYGSFDMSAGSIYGNIAKYNYNRESGDGGGVYIEGGSFTLTGGSISGNNSYCDGGGVYVKDYVINTNNKYDGIFTMTGGSIYENKTGDEGGNGGGVCVRDDSNFTMSGDAVIRNNQAQEGNGGGVYVENSSFTLSGAAEISGNTLTAGNTANNVLLQEGTYITVNGALGGTGRVGITCKDVPPCKAAAGYGYTLSENALEYFFSDDPAYLLDLDRESNEIKLVPPCSHEHTEIRNKRVGTCSANGYTGDECCTKCNAVIKKGEATPIDPDNHYFDLNNENLKKVTREPTLLQKGIHTYTCAWCKKATMELEDIPCLPDEKGRDLEDLREDVADLSGNNAPKVEEKKDDKGNDVETVTIGGEEVSKIVTDPESGKETVDTKVWITGLKESYTYTGSAIRPKFHVYDGTKLLKEKTDYTVSFKNNKDAGKAKITLKFKGNYSDTTPETVDFEIKPAVLGVDIIAHETGTAEKKSAQKPVPMLTWAATGKTVSSKDFGITYDPSPVKAAGDYTATITPKKADGNFAGSTTALIKVRDKNSLLSNAKVTFDKKSYEYTGKAIVPKYTLKMGTSPLTEGADYKLVSITGNTNPGSATVIFEALSGNSAGYVGSKTAAFKISGKIALKDEAPFEYSYSESVPFAKGGAKPAVTVKYDGTALKEGIDYTVSYTKNKAVTEGATAELKIKGKGNFKGTVTRKFAVTRQSLSLLKENITVKDQFTMKSKVKKPSVTITDLDGKKLKAGTDYTVGTPDLSDPANTDTKGTAKVVITGKGAYFEDEVPMTFRYEDKAFDLSKAKAAKISDQPFTGNAVKLSNADLTGKLTVKDGSGNKVELVPGKDFIVKGYSSNAKCGTAKVTLKGTGTFAGTKTVTFKIVKKKVNYKGRIV